MKAFKKILFAVAMIVMIIVFAPNMNIISFDDIPDSSYVSAAGVTTTNMEECERTDALGWIFCGIADSVTGVIDVLINEYIVPLLWWRFLI